MFSKNLKSKLFLLILLTVFYSTTVSARTYQIEKILMSWIGEPVSKLVTQWGYPDEETKIMDKKVYIWHHDKFASAGFIAMTHKWYCDRKIFVDDSGIIVHAESEGNNCPFGSIGQYRNWANKDNYEKIPVDHTKVLHRSTSTLAL